MPTDLPQLTDGMKLEDVGCPLCGSRRWVLLVEAADPDPGRSSHRYAVVRCTVCELCFTNPRPTPCSIGLAYPEQYGPHQSGRASSRSPRRRWWSRQLAQWRGRRQLPWHGQGRLLDFGCGSGSFLKRMQLEGWKVVGLDSSPQVVQHIRSELGLPVLIGSLPHPELPPESFDVITMWQALEHVHDPLAVLQAARRLVVRGGRLVVAVPNVQSAPFRWFGPDWFGLDLPRHLIHFTPQTLRRTVQRAGFGIEQFRFVGHATWLENSARRAARRGVKLGWRRSMLVRTVCRAVAPICVRAGTADAMMLTAVAE